MDTKRSTIPAAEEILGLYFPVLDHGYISLVDYMGGDADIDRAAKTSYGATGKPRLLAEIRTLIRYLRRHKHTSPTEMVELKFHCAMPIFIARQWIRHRTANVNETSGRYSKLKMLFYTPEADVTGTQSKTNKQGRGNLVSPEMHEEMVARWKVQRGVAECNYDWMTESDVALELARIDLPLSTYTSWYWKIDLHNLLHFLTLRADSHAQHEIQVFARIMAGMVKRVAPASYEAWIDYDVCGARMSRMEMEVIRMLIRANEGGEFHGQLWSDSEMLSHGYLRAHHFGERELNEFLAKLRTPEGIPDFELNLTSALPKEHFEAMYEPDVKK